MNSKATRLNNLYQKYIRCTLCPLALFGRNSIVFGEGNPNATIMCIGEGPGKKEDETGRPFMGKAGEILNNALKSADIDRKSIYITNVIKCRPPKNRKPTTPEITACINALLTEQIRIIEPKIIIALGTIALKGLIGTKHTLKMVVGTPIKTKNTIIIPTYHPAYTLRNPQAKKLLTESIGLAKTLSKPKQD